MTPEEIEAAKAAAEVEQAQAIESNPLIKLQEENKKLSEERDNYKAVALKRLGKLPGDAEFLDGDNDSGLSVAEQVRIELLNREIAKNKEAEQAEVRRITKENAELRLALKNRPGSSIGGDSGSSVDVKDNVFSPAQITALTEKAKRLKADPTTFIENAKRNFLSR